VELCQPFIDLAIGHELLAIAIGILLCTAREEAGKKRGGNEHQRALPQAAC
jgi:hypothetical protein